MHDNQNQGPQDTNQWREFLMIVLEYTTELVRLIGLLPTLVLCCGIGLALCQCMFAWLCMTGPPEN